MKNRYGTLKYCAYAFVLTATFLLQGTRAVSLHVFGFSLDLMPFFVSALALLDGPYAAGSLGFVAGLLCSIISPSPDGAISIYYALFGICAGLYARTYMRPIVPSVLLVGTVGMLGLDFFAYIFYYGLVYKLPPLPFVIELAGDVAVSLLPAALMFLIVKRLHLHFTAGGEA